MKKLRGLLLVIALLLLIYQLLMETGLMVKVTEAWENFKNSEFVTSITDAIDDYMGDEDEISTETLQVRLINTSTFPIKNKP